MIRLILLTALALFAFAANSLLARAALDSGDMGAAEFTLIRLICGALMLAVLVMGRAKSLRGEGSWAGGAMLALYAGAFSFAYTQLSTGVGALALFAAVQITMMGYAVFTRGLSVKEMLGAAIAIFGFIYLILPSLESGSFWGFLLMSLSGIGWAVYTLLGKASMSPLALNAGNFWRASLLSLPLLALVFSSPSYSYEGALLAAASGAITSGIGYAIWYAALPRLTTPVAATLQLLVPPIAAFMGWAFLGEDLTQRLIVSTLIISSGIVLVIHAQNRAH